MYALGGLLRNHRSCSKRICQQYQRYRIRNLVHQFNESLQLQCWPPRTVHGRLPMIVRLITTIYAANHRLRGTEDHSERSFRTHHVAHGRDEKRRPTQSNPNLVPP